MLKANLCLLLNLLPFMLCGNVIAGTLSMDKTGFCGEHKQAEYNGTGRTISFSIIIDGVEHLVVITSNTEDPKYLGEYKIKLVNTTSTDWPYIRLYNIAIEYNMSSEISGQRLRINATNEDQVSAQTTIQSCNCSFPVRIQQQNISESHFMLTVLWEHPQCCGWDRELVYTVQLKYMDCEACSESLTTKSTNTSFSVSKPGRYNVLVSAENICGEVTTANATRTVGADTAGNHVIAESTGYTLLIIAALGAVVMYTCFT